jgi:hypothetical protein
VAGRTEAVDDASNTEWVVIRPEGHIAGSELASVFEGEWRRRVDVGDADSLELPGPYGIVRAFPTDRIETSPAGDLAQVWEVPGDTGVTDTRGGLDAPHSVS